MSKGVLLFAHNNKEIDYVMMAYVCAKFVIKNLEVPVSLVTNESSIRWIESQNAEIKNIFDHIIIIEETKIYQEKRFYDGTLDYKKSQFNNISRSQCFDLSPYDQTLVIDTDVLITNEKLKNIWDTESDFMINKNHFDLAQNRDTFEFVRTYDQGIDFYWATAFYFRKTPETKIFFDLCKHIVENYNFYKFSYQLPGNIVRNDYVFSIAIHIISGFGNKNKPDSLPCQIYYITDRDELFKVYSDKEFAFLVQKIGYSGEYVLTKTNKQNLHIMNKYSFNRHIPSLLEVLNDN